MIKMELPEGWKIVKHKGAYNFLWYDKEWGWICIETIYKKGRFWVRNYVPYQYNYFTLGQAYKAFLKDQKLMK